MASRTSIRAIARWRMSSLLPHIGSATVETRLAMGYMALDNLDAVLVKHTAPPDRVV